MMMFDVERPGLVPVAVPMPEGYLNGMKRMLQYSYTLARARHGPLDPLARRSYL